jgi:glycosyltransferase involved in cell wall biosynthesis
VTAAPGTSFHYSPLKLKEYLAAGVPVVAPSIGEMRRMLQHGCTALLYDPKDTGSLAWAIEHLAGRRRLRHALATAGRVLCDREFSIGRQVGQVVDRLAERSAG